MVFVSARHKNPVRINQSSYGLKSPDQANFQAPKYKIQDLVLKKQFFIVRLLTQSSTKGESPPLLIISTA